MLVEHVAVQRQRAQRRRQADDACRRQHVRVAHQGPLRRHHQPHHSLTASATARVFLRSALRRILPGTPRCSATGSWVQRNRSRAASDESQRPDSVHRAHAARTRFLPPRPAIPLSVVVASRSSSPAADRAMPMAVAAAAAPPAAAPTTPPPPASSAARMDWLAPATRAQGSSQCQSRALGRSHAATQRLQVRCRSRKCVWAGGLLPTCKGVSGLSVLLVLSPEHLRWHAWAQHKQRVPATLWVRASHHLRLRPCPVQPQALPQHPCAAAVPSQEQERS